MGQNEDVLFEVRDGAGYITFNRPQARNALNFGMYDRLRDIATAVDNDREIRVLLLSGAGEKAFASGTDIGEFRSLSTAGRRAGL